MLSNATAYEPPEASLYGITGASPPRLSADARGFVPPQVRTLFDNPLPTIVLPPDSVLADGRAAELSMDGTRVASCAAFGLLSRQLPVGATSWPSINDGLSNSRLLIDTVVQSTAHPVTALTPGRYAEHSIALLAAEVASSRAEVSSYDLHGAEIAVAPLSPDLCVASLYVPGAAENMPALAYGSVVRLRPSWKPRSDGSAALLALPDARGASSGAADALIGDLIDPFIEIEARVQSVSLARSVVELLLPSTWRVKTCLRCAALHAAGQLLAWPTPLSAACPPLSSRCRHFSLCEFHAAECTMFGFPCPLCFILHCSDIHAPLTTPLQIPIAAGIAGVASFMPQPFCDVPLSAVIGALRWSARFEFRFAPVQSVVEAIDAHFEDVVVKASYGVRTPALARLFPCVGDLPAAALLRGTLARRLCERQSVDVSAKPASDGGDVPISTLVASDGSDSESDDSDERPSPPRAWINTQLNDQQRGAVEAIVSKRHGAVPYLLVGPAGTGKTSTLVEAILQVLWEQRRSPCRRGGGGTAPRDLPAQPAHVLVVAPSDEAADLVLLALHAAFAAPAPVADPDLVSSATAPASDTTLMTTLGLCPVLALPPPSTLRTARTHPRHGILRFNLPSRKSDSLQHATLLQYCVTDARQGMFTVPSASLLVECRVIVATALSCATLRSALGKSNPAATEAAEPPKEFSHLFFDEASQCLEAESLVPLTLAGPTTSVIITGDPKQLGPVVRSPLAASRGLSVSLQERIMAPYEGPRHPGMVLHCEVADAALAGGQASLASRGRAPRGARGASRLGALVLDSLQTAASGSHVGGSDRFADDDLPAGYHLVRCIYSDEMLRERLSHPQVLSTTLTANYRSHPTLLMLPSLLFYGGSLESRAPPALTSSCLSWSWLSRGAVTPSDSGTPPATHNGGGGGFPLLCLGVAGDDSHLVDSPSFWNLAEIEYVCAAITSLIEESRRAGAPLTALDVGVISPYRQQVLRLRRALRAANLGSVSVGSVANFQGGEKKAIFISTVLSSNYGERACRGTGATAASEDASLLLPRAIGLFGDSKPFNVAITRAQSLLVCVGNPLIWALDPHWSKLLQFAVDHGAYQSRSGVPCPLQPTTLGLGLTASAPLLPARNKRAPSSPLLPAASAISVSSTASADPMEEVQRRLAEVLSLRELEGAWRLMM